MNYSMKLKRLIFIFGIFLIASTTFSQPLVPNGASIMYINYRPAFEFRTLEAYFAYEQGVDGRFVHTLTPHKLKAKIDSPDTTREYRYFMKYLDENAYSFTANGKFYMLSYDTCNNVDDAYIERGLYLFRLDDNGWMKACYQPVQVDYRNMNGDSKYYFPWRVAGKDGGHFRGGATNGKIEVSADGTVRIVIINYESKNEIKYSNKTIMLVPNGDGTYTLQ